MYKIGIALLSLGVLAACGNNDTSRAASGGGAGALGGAVVGGPVGAVVGGVGGATAGASMNEGLEDKTTLDERAKAAIKK
ncbi:hypothetical protein [Arenibaculum pallidiluteum]|uniref:hypothetical protein n=1 Tax=Arenibaculum pallidiluteum TaxID=2812559 RepID=UPI001A9773EA|nr:hypothetical protein [Arenibaculum pallidiluteum]